MAVIKPVALPEFAVSIPAAVDIPIKKIVLKNGLTVLIREDHSLPLVSVRIVFEGGVLVEKESNNGISQLVSRLLLKGTGERYRSSDRSGDRRLRRFDQYLFGPE